MEHVSLVSLWLLEMDCRVCGVRPQFGWLPFTVCSRRVNSRMIYNFTPMPGVTTSAPNISESVDYTVLNRTIVFISTLLATSGHAWCSLLSTLSIHTG